MRTQVARARPFVFINKGETGCNCLIFEQTNDLDRERRGESRRGILLEMQRRDRRRGWERGLVVPSHSGPLSRRQEEDSAAG